MTSTISRATNMLESRGICRFVVSSCRANTLSIRATQQRSFRLSSRYYDNDDANNAKDANKSLSFRGQLYASTAQRLQRERAELARTVNLRESRDRQTALRNTMVTIMIVTLGSVGYWVGNRSPKPLDSSSTTPLSAAQPPQLDTRNTTLQATWVDLAQICGKENVSTTKDDLEAHAGSEWSSYARKPVEVPFVVVYPATTEEVSKIMKVCHHRKVPVTALSGGTSLEGHFAPTRGGVCIDLARMDKIVDFHPQDLDIVVQPALGWEDLNEYLEESGMFFPPDPGPGARIGGMVGTGCSGTNAFRYGTMRDWVASLTVVMADGTIVKTRRRPRKSSAGYNLTQMFIGSEGTLGIVTEATLKITVLPKNQSVAVATFPTIHDAADCVSKIVAEGLQLEGMEIMDDVQMRVINDSGSTSRKWEETASLFFKFAGTANGVKDQINTVKKLAKVSKNKTFEFARNSDEAKELWSARKEALWSVMGKRRDETDHVWTTDVAVPISRLPDIIQETKDHIAESGLLGAIVGHVGDGNFHTILLYNDKEKKTAEDVVERMIKRAIEMEGTITGEHGVGLKKRENLIDELGNDTVNAMRKLKQAYDPLCILNCDKIIQMEKGK